MKLDEPRNRKDCLAFCLTNEERLEPLLHASVDRYYEERGLCLVKDATAEISKFSLRTYRHIAGGQSQVIISSEGNNYHFFVTDSEDSNQAEIRRRLN